MDQEDPEVLPAGSGAQAAQAAQAVLGDLVAPVDLEDLAVPVARVGAGADSRSFSRRL